MKSLLKFLWRKKTPRAMTVAQLLDANLAAGCLTYVWEVNS